jgi:S-adenosylmethionine synthetase
LRIDPNAKVACETATKSNMIVLLGEISLDRKKINLE